MKCVQIFLIVGLGLIVSCAQLGLAQAGSDFDVYLMLCMVNTERDNYGIYPLALDGSLVNAAQQHCLDMAATNDLDHDVGTGDPLSRITDYGYPDANSYAENIAFGQPNMNAVMTEWMNSAGHKQNILDTTVTSFGAAVAISGDGTPYYTQEFAGNGEDVPWDVPICPYGAENMNIEV